MPSALDRDMDETIARLTARDAPLALSEATVGGRRYATIAAAPPALPQYFAYYCQQHAEAEFLVAGEERLTFAEVYAVARDTAGALISGFGLRRGERIGIAMRNCPSWIVLYMAIQMAGGVATLLNGWWSAEELAGAVDDVDCRLVFADPPRAERLAGSPVERIAIDDRQPVRTALAPVLDRGGTDAALPEVGPEDDATILFTSGSTGRSKGALSDQRAVVQGVFAFLSQALTMLDIATARGNAPTGQPATLLSVPLFHVTGEVPVMLQSFAMGRKLVLIPKWDAEEAMRLMERERATYFIGVPSMSFEMLTHPNRGRYDLSTVTDFGSGGAPRPVGHVARIAREMGGGAPLIGYGLTETNAVGCGNWRENYLAKPESTGRAAKPLVEVAVLDPGGHPVAAGVRGEVGIRTIANFKCYWGNPDATRAAFGPEGHFRTGDLGYLDEDGYLFITGRAKDVIIRGGENIAAQEVEAAIHSHPAVAECAVFGLPDERLGEVPAAVVRYHDGTAPTGEALCAFLAEHIAAFKLPVRVWTVDTPLPRLGTEKIDKQAIAATYRAQVAAA